MRSPRRDSGALGALAVLALIGAPAAPLGAQDARPARAFPPAITPYIGLTSFGSRLTQGLTTFSYSNSLSVGARAEWPLTRRSGIALDVDVAPIVDQMAETQSQRTLGDRVITWHATVAGAWRFKPGAPVFFSLGAAMFGATKAPEPDRSGTVIEPEGNFSIGYDGRPFAGWNPRAMYTGHLVKPSDSDGAAVAKSVAYDWSFVVGLRYVPGASKPRTQP